MTHEVTSPPGPESAAAGQSRPWVRVGVPVLLTVTLYAIVLFALLSPPRRPPAELPLVPETVAWPSHPVRFRATVTTGYVHLHRLRLFTRSMDIAKLSEIRLFLATYKTQPRLLSAQLLLAGTPCTFDTAPGATLEDNHLLSFVRGTGCSGISGPASGQLELVVRIKGPGEVAAWTFVPPTGASDPGWIVVSEPGTTVAGVQPVVRGSGLDTPPPTNLKRIDLLTYMWQLSARSTWIWLSLLASFGLALAGSLTFPMRRLPELPARARVRSALMGGLGAFCFATSLSVAYAVLVPPLMAPDEPFHLLGFAALNGNAKIASGTESWTRLTHLNRIRFHGNEHFRPEDIGHPWPVADPFLGATEVRVRSASATGYWRGLGHLVHDRSAEQTLLAVRLSNALVFGLVVGVATALGIALTSVAYPQLLCFPFLFVPTLPFFAMAVLDYSVLCGAYVLVAASLCVLFLDGPRAHWVGFPLGLSVAVMIAANRSSLPLTGVVAMALAVRLVLGSRGSRTPLKAALIFWLGLGIGASAFTLLIEKTFESVMSAQLHAVLPRVAASPLVFVVRYRALVIALTIVGALIEIALHRVRSATATVLGKRAIALLRLAVGALAAAVVISFLGSLVAPLPHVPFIQVSDAQAYVPSLPSQNDYVADVLATAATIFRLREPDLLLFASFFGGFGWIDTVPPTPFLIGLAVLIGGSLSALALFVARTEEIRRFFWLFALFVGCGGSLALYALSCYGVPVNLHGRYLIGWYLCWLSIALSAVAVIEVPRSWVSGRRIRERRTIARPAAPLVLCGLIHSYCLSFILLRYF